MSINVEEIRKLAELSRLEFGADAEKEIAAELANILEFVSQLQQVNTAGVAPMASTVAAQGTPQRPDEVSEQVDVAKNQACAPAAEMGFYVVPRVVE